MLQLHNSQQTMTSKEIAELVESRHDDVKRSIERLSTITYNEDGTVKKPAAISKPPMADGIKSANGVVEKMYLINKRDSYVIVAQLSPTFTARLVDRWQELEAQTPKFDISTITKTQLALMVIESEQEKQKLIQQIEADAPNVEFAMAVRRMEGACKIGEFGKVIGIGQNKLFAQLRRDDILMGNNLPYQRYIDAEYFVVIEQFPYTDRSGKAHPTFTTHVTGKGQVWLEKKYRMN